MVVLESLIPLETPCGLPEVKTRSRLETCLLEHRHIVPIFGNHPDETPHLPGHSLRAVIQNQFWCWNYNQSLTELQSSSARNRQAP